MFRQLFHIALLAVLWSIQPIAANHHPTTVTGIRILSALTVSEARSCPKKIQITGEISTILPSRLKYQFVYSDGYRTLPKLLKTHRPGRYKVTTKRKFEHPFHGWVKLKIVGQERESGHFSLQVRCRQPHPRRPAIISAEIQRVPSGRVGGTEGCPKTLHFQGTIRTSRAAEIKYRLLRSDGTMGPIKHLSAPRAGTYHIRTQWRVTHGGEKWVRLKIIEPQQIRTSKAHFRVRCRPTGVTHFPRPMQISEFRLEATPQLPERYHGECPTTINFKGEFLASRAGMIRYRFIRSDGYRDTVHTLRIPAPGFYAVSYSWRIGQSSRGWVRMEILEPLLTRSNKAHFDVTCIDPAPAPANLKVSIDAPREAHEGESLANRVRLTVRNHGETAAKGTQDGRGYQIDLILSSDRASKPRFETYSDTYRDNVLLKNGRVRLTDTLMPGAAQSYYPDAVLPTHIPAGDYYLCARVDPGNAVRESREHDNLSCVPLRILPRRLQPPPPNSRRPVPPRPIVTETPTDTTEPKEAASKLLDRDHDQIDDRRETALLKRFRPYFKYATDEHYLPSDALYQLQHATPKKGTVKEGLPSFLTPDALPGCSSSEKRPLKLLSCKKHALDLRHTPQASTAALDLDNRLRKDPGSGRSDDWDRAISIGAGLYGHVVKDGPLIKIEYWQFYPYSEADHTAQSHEGDWETLQLWYDPTKQKLVGTCHWAHGAGICFDMKRAQPYRTENGFVHYRGRHSTKPLLPIMESDLKSERYPADYQNRQISFYTEDGGMHPVIFVEKGNHAFWPSAEGSVEGGAQHDGSGHNYLGVLDPQQRNLGEFGAALPHKQHPNSLILHYNGYWGAEHQRYALPPYGPTQRCQWQHDKQNSEKSRALHEACQWE